MAEIDFTKVLTDSDGEPILTNDAPPKQLTLRRACQIALDRPVEKDANEGLSAKLKRGKIIETIVASEKDATPIALPAESIALIKERAAMVFTAASTVLQISRLLDPATE